MLQNYKYLDIVAQRPFITAHTVETKVHNRGMEYGSAARSNHGPVLFIKRARESPRGSFMVAFSSLCDTQSTIAGMCMNHM